MRGSSLKVLQSCPSQCNALLASIDIIDSVSLTIEFDLFDVKPHLPYHVALQIKVVHGGKTIGQIVIIWRYIYMCDLFVVASNTLLTAFDRIYFFPRGILDSFHI